MYESVILHKTADGTLHQTSDKAEAHVSDLIHTKLDNILQDAIRQVCDGSVTRADQHKIVELMYERRKDIVAVVEMEVYGNDGKHWDGSPI